MATDLTILFEVDLEPGKLFNGDILEESLLVLLLGILDFGYSDLRTRCLLSKPREDDVCLSTGLASGIFHFAVFTLISV